MNIVYEFFLHIQIHIHEKDGVSACLFF